jgi:hypothetical protein
LVTKQQPTLQLLSMQLGLCKLARLYCREHPGDALAFADAVTTTAAAAVSRYRGLQAANGTEVTSSTSSAAASSSSSSSGSSLPLWLYAVTARGLHTLAWSLEQAIASAASSGGSSSSSYASADAAALRFVSESGGLCLSLQALVLNLGDANAVCNDSATCQRLNQLGELLLAAEVSQPALAALDALGAGSTPGLGPDKDLQKWVQQLQQFAAAAAAAVPLANACNNPSCSELGGLSEAALVKGRRCSRCKAGYCSEACQTAHWKQHKTACKLLAAAGARAWAL